MAETTSTVENWLLVVESVQDEDPAGFLESIEDIYQAMLSETNPNWSHWAKIWSYLAAHTSMRLLNHQITIDGYQRGLEQKKKHFREVKSWVEAYKLGLHIPHKNRNSADAFRTQLVNLQEPHRQISRALQEIESLTKEEEKSYPPYLTVPPGSFMSLYQLKLSIAREDQEQHTTTNNDQQSAVIKVSATSVEPHVDDAQEDLLARIAMLEYQAALQNTKRREFERFVKNQLSALPQSVQSMSRIKVILSAIAMDNGNCGVGSSSQEGFGI